MSTSGEDVDDLESELVSEDLGSDEEFVLGGKKKGKIRRGQKRGTRSRKRVRKALYSSDEELGRYGYPVRVTGRQKESVK